ncbi:MAG: alpha/beta fold hydrolase [Vicinamibacteraceae bacterium]
MERLKVGGEEIEFSDTGTGEPVLLVHAGVFSDWFVPVAASIELDGCRVIRVRRAGYVSGRTSVAHLTLSDHARHCGLLMDAIGIETAHVCGHSSGALVGLELALARPASVRTLVLLEPAPCGGLAGPSAEVAGPAFGAALAAHAAGEGTTAFDGFMRTVGGERWGAVVESALGSDGRERAISESSYFFADEMPACLEWQFGPDEAARVLCPVLVVEGEETANAADLHDDAAVTLAAMVPGAELAVLAGTNHLLPLQDPNGVAALVAGFAVRHPIGRTSPVPS